ELGEPRRGSQLAHGFGVGFELQVVHYRHGSGKCLHASDLRGVESVTRKSRSEFLATQGSQTKRPVFCDEDVAAELFLKSVRNHLNACVRWSLAEGSIRANGRRARRVVQGE